MSDTSAQTELPVRERLLAAARECFLHDDYHAVSTRNIAAAARTNISMIRYYFGGKGGLYEEMIRDTLRPLLDALSAPDDGCGVFPRLFRLYYDTMLTRPQFPRLVLKVLALNQAPGRQVLWEMLHRGKRRGEERLDTLRGQVPGRVEIDADLARIAFVSLAMTPMLLKEIFEEEMGRPMDAAFLERLAQFNGALFQTAFGVSPCPSNASADALADSPGC